MKLQVLIKQLLEKYPELRDSDKKLIWSIYHVKGLVNDFNMIDRDSFYSAPSEESITRCRRKIQEKYPHLQATKKVEQERKRLEAIYRENKGNV